MKTITYKTNKPDSSDTYICMLEFYYEDCKGIWRSNKMRTDGKNGIFEVYINTGYPDNNLEWEKYRQYSDSLADYESSWTADIDDALLMFEAIIY